MIACQWYNSFFFSLRIVFLPADKQDYIVRSSLVELCWLTALTRHNALSDWCYSCPPTSALDRLLMRHTDSMPLETVFHVGETTTKNPNVSMIFLRELEMKVGDYIRRTIHPSKTWIIYSSEPRSGPRLFTQTLFHCSIWILFHNSWEVRAGWQRHASKDGFYYYYFIIKLSCNTYTHRANWHAFACLVYIIYVQRSTKLPRQPLKTP